MEKKGRKCKNCFWYERLNSKDYCTVNGPTWVEITEATLGQGSIKQHWCAKGVWSRHSVAVPGVSPEQWHFVYAADMTKDMSKHDINANPTAKTIDTSMLDAPPPGYVTGVDGEYKPE
jgi:hypothetical protein